MFKRVLIANRGEIALRVIRACRELDVATVAVYSDADRDSLHADAADEAVHLGPTQPAASYLNIERILDVATRTGCDAIHPGYGFLAESAAFVRACSAAGITFIGPSAKAMEQMGGKLAARANARNAGVPVVPGSQAAVVTAAQVRAIGHDLGYPIAIKASAGGGGKGLKVAGGPDQVESAISLAAAEAGAYFGDATLYVERYLESPKHIEIQVLGDKHGTVVHLGERDCSLQRRHQKLVEETPAHISAGLRGRMCDAAVKLSRSIGYDSAGTIECLVDGDEFFFLEMNTRIQVEHTISEAIYGFDLVKAQIRIAAGERLWLEQDDLRARGHAIECRINAESPAASFAPCAGRIAAYNVPGGPGIRVDGAAFAGWEITSDYDSLVAKLVAWGTDREEARRRMLRALAEYQIEGIQTTIPFYSLLLSDPAFVRADYSTSTVDGFARDHRAAIAAAYDDGSAGGPQPPGAEAQPARVVVELDDKRYRVSVYGLPNGPDAPTRRMAAYHGRKGTAHGGPAIAAPMHGIVAEIRVGQGDAVSSGQVVAIIEAMKMMNEVIANMPGTIAAVNAKVGDTVEAGTPLLFFAEASPGL